MSYDFDTSPTSLPKAAEFVPQSRDLETIVVLLQMAAIELTPTPGKEFTAEQLVAKARELAGDEVAIKDGDVAIVLGKAGFLKKVGSKLQLK